MATFKVDDLKSRLPGGGARANLFRATVEFPGYAGGDSNLISFLCKGAQLPASVVGQVDVPFRGQVLKVAGDRTYENWTVTIINDDLFRGRDAFERWMNGINQNKTNQGIVSPSTYQADMVVEQLTRDDLVARRSISEEPSLSMFRLLISVMIQLMQSKNSPLNLLTNTGNQIQPRKS